VIKAVIALAVFSALCAMALTLFAPAGTTARATPLVNCFMQSFQDCFIALLGLLGGKSLR